MAALVPHTPLSTAIRVNRHDSDADVAKIRDKAVFLQMTGLEQPEQAPGEPGARGPSKAEPQGTLACIADQRRTEVFPVAGVLPRLICLIDGIDRQLLLFRQRCHDWLVSDFIGGGRAA